MYYESYGSEKTIRARVYSNPEYASLPRDIEILAELPAIGEEMDPFHAPGTVVARIEDRWFDPEDRSNACNLYALHEVIERDEYGDEHETLYAIPRFRRAFEEKVNPVSLFHKVEVAFGETVELGWGFETLDEALEFAKDYDLAAAAEKDGDCAKASLYVYPNDPDYEGDPLFERYVHWDWTHKIFVEN